RFLDLTLYFFFVYLLVFSSVVTSSVRSKAVTALSTAWVTLNLNTSAASLALATTCLSGWSVSESLWAYFLLLDRNAFPLSFFICLRFGARITIYRQLDLTQDLRSFNLFCTY